MTTVKGQLISGIMKPPALINLWASSTMSLRYTRELSSSIASVPEQIEEAGDEDVYHSVVTHSQ